MLVLVQDSAETLASSYIQPGDLVRIAVTDPEGFAAITDTSELATWMTTVNTGWAEELAKG